MAHANLELPADYRRLLKQAQSLLASETDVIANAANMASLVFNNVAHLNWAGFYFLRHDELVLGPFCGQVACTRIAVGNGVCGTAFLRQETLVVADVHDFDGHIACDAASEAEIVVPFNHPLVAGVMDIDSPRKNRFGKPEQLLFEGLCEIYCASIEQG